MRPEYLEAVNAARWNLWLVPLFLVAPILLGMAAGNRWQHGKLYAVVIASFLVTWFALFFYTEHIWIAMESNAQTAAEQADVSADTGRHFGPIVVGGPFALIYTMCWLAVASFFRNIAIWLQQRKLSNSAASIPDYSEYRRSLVIQYSRSVRNHE